MRVRGNFCSVLNIFQHPNKALSFGLAAICFFATMVPNSNAVDPRYGAVYTTGSNVGQDVKRGLRIVAESDAATWHNADGLIKYFRFNVQPPGSQFYAAGHNLKGVGRDDAGGFTDMGTMISPSFCVGSTHSGRHVLPTQYLRLYRWNSPTTITWERHKVVETRELGNPDINQDTTMQGADGSDFEVCRMETKISINHAIYPILSVPTSATDEWETLCFGKMRQSSMNMKVAKRFLTSEESNVNAQKPYVREFYPTFNSWQKQHNDYSFSSYALYVLSPSEVTPAPIHQYPYVSAKDRFKVFPGHEYLLVGEATAGGGAYIHWKGANSWSNKQFSSGGFRLKATAPAATTSIGVTLENGGTISQVSLRDVTLTVGRNPGDDECDVFNGDSGSPSLTFDRTGALDESVPCPPYNPDLDSWGLILVGTHRSPYEDNGVIGTDAAAEMTTLVKDMQTGNDNLKEVPIFWSGVFGDFDGDENLTVNDVNILVRKVGQRSTNGYSWYLDWDTAITTTMMLKPTLRTIEHFTPKLATWISTATSMLMTPTQSSTTKELLMRDGRQGI